MKKITLKAAAAVGLSALLMGSAAAQSSVSQPVGYETFSINQATNYIGLRLVGSPVTTTTVATTDPGTGVITLDSDAPADGVYVLEANDGDALGSVVEAIVADGVISVEVAVLGDLEAGASVTLRTPQTLAGIFGDPINGRTDPTLGLNGGSNSTSADLILIPDGNQGFTTYFFSNGGLGGVGAGWRELDVATNENVPVDASAINLFYTDGMVIQNRGADNNLVISGNVKVNTTRPALIGSATYLSNLYPAGSTLSTLFDDPNEPGVLGEGTIEGGSNSSSADLVIIPNDEGGLDTYFFSNGGLGGIGAGWRQLDVTANTTTNIDSTTISFEDVSSIIIINRGDDRNIFANPPSFYGDLVNGGL